MRHRNVLSFIVGGMVLLMMLSGCQRYYYPYLLDVRETVVPPERAHSKPNQVRPRAIICDDQRTKKTKAILFVHGALGEGTTTWGDLDEDTSWPIMIKNDSAFDDFNVFVYGYNTNVLDYSSDITELAIQLKETLTNRKVFECHEQIHFISHSMGGLVVKRFLTSLYLRGEQSLLQKVRTVFFQGTPAGGTRLANWASWFSFNPQVGNVSSADMNTYLKTLEQDWQEYLDTRDPPYRPFPHIYCSHETKGTFLNVFVVDRMEAKTQCNGPSYAIDENHINMVKPPYPSVEPYPWTKRLIEEASERQALMNDTVVLMDASHPDTVYSQSAQQRGATNADTIDLLIRKSEIPLKTLKELVNYDWNRDEAVKKMNPALIIIHLSSFYRKPMDGESYDAYKVDIIDTRFRKFIENMLETDTKFLIYSRIDKPEHCADISEESYEAGQNRRKLLWNDEQEYFKNFSRRMDWFAIPPPKSTRNGGCATFEDSAIQREMVRRIKILLNIDKIEFSTQSRKNPRMCRC